MFFAYVLTWFWWFLKIYVLHGSVATQLKCGGIINNYVIVNCSQNVAIKKFRKLVNIRLKYGKWKVGRFWDTEYKQNFTVSAGSANWEQNQIASNSIDDL